MGDYTVVIPWAEVLDAEEVLADFQAGAADLEAAAPPEGGDLMGITYPACFFSGKEKKQILDAIQEAEKNTSGEIRVHLEFKAREPVYGHAQKVFQRIGMTKTEQRNGVLIFLATHNKKFAVLGDVGINEKVPEGFWNDVAGIMQENFKQNKFAEGISGAALRIGEKLKAYFPYRSGDKNELSDGISY
jgi:uncharacterized membrane protein